MKKITLIAIAIFSITFISCNKEKTATPNETDGLKLLKVISNDTNSVELLSFQDTIILLKFLLVKCLLVMESDFLLMCAMYKNTN